jgi:hypothetical protein
MEEKVEVRGGSYTKGAEISGNSYAVALEAAGEFLWLFPLEQRTSVPVMFREMHFPRYSGDRLKQTSACSLPQCHGVREGAGAGMFGKDG